MQKNYEVGSQNDLMEHFAHSTFFYRCILSSSLKPLHLHILNCGKALYKIFLVTSMRALQPLLQRIRLFLCI